MGFDMNTKINKIKQSAAEYFKKHQEIEVSYIFGSVAQNRTNALSDIDIGVILDRSKIDDKLYPYGYRANLISDLIKLLKTNKVDVVLLDDASILLRHRILYYGKIIYSGNEERRIKFQVETINKYNDYKNLLKYRIKKHKTA